MALNDITIVDGAVTKVFSYIGTSNNTGKSAVRADTSASLAEPVLLEISHQPGSQTKPDRHLVRLNETEQSTSDPSVFETGGVHVVFTAPRNVIPLEDIVTLFRRLHIYLKGGASDYDNLRGILRGQLG